MRHRPFVGSPYHALCRLSWLHRHSFLQCNPLNAPHNLRIPFRVFCNLQLRCCLFLPTRRGLRLRGRYIKRFDSRISVILTTLCNYSSPSYRISKWTDSSRMVCRYCQQKLEKLTCTICSTSKTLWICGFAGCGRYKSGHVINHKKETKHCYSLDEESQRVWHNIGKNYVHRFIQSKSDGKPAEFNTHFRGIGDGCGKCESSYDYEIEIFSLILKLKQ